jgi:hypothetical protein
MPAVDEPNIDVMSVLDEETIFWKTKPEKLIKHEKYAAGSPEDSFLAYNIGLLKTRDAAPLNGKF